MSQTSRFALLANPGGRRALGFVAACRAQGLAEPVIIPWEMWLTPGFDPTHALEGIDSLRIETPAEHAEVERQILVRGAEACREENLYPCLPVDACLALPEDEGELRFQRQWYLGWQQVLHELTQCCKRFALRSMNHPVEIATLFDKEATRAVLEKHHVPVPPAAGICASFDDLAARMDACGWNRVFLKPCHGSSASGVIALARHPRGEWLATTSAVLEGTRIRNSKRLRRMVHLDEIRATVDAVCLQRALMERWFPKATWGGKVFDLRVVVIRGEAAHVAVRTSSFPITNLHLHNRRGQLEALIEALGHSRWQAAMDVALAAAAAFPGCHYCGADLMIGKGGRMHAIAEVNAFGDLLHRELWQGMNPWEAELARWGTALTRSA